MDKYKRWMFIENEFILAGVTSFSVCLSSLTFVVVYGLAAPLALDIKLRHLNARPISCQSFSTPSALHKHLQFI